MRIADCFLEWYCLLDFVNLTYIKKAINAYVLKIEPGVNPQFTIRNPQLLVGLLNFKESQLLGFVIWMGVMTIPVVATSGCKKARGGNVRRKGKVRPTR